MLQLARMPRVTAIGAIVAWSCLGAAMFASSEAIAQLDDSGWTSRVINLPPSSADARPPVATSVALHPGGTTLAIAGDDHVVHLWNLRTQQFTKQLRGHRDWVRTVTYSPNGKVLASAGNDHHIILWDPTAATPLHNTLVMNAASRQLRSVPMEHNWRRLASTK